MPHVQHAFFYAFKLIKFFNNLWVVVSIFIVDAKTVVINNDLVKFFRDKSEVKCITRHFEIKFNLPLFEYLQILYFDTCYAKYFLS